MKGLLVFLGVIVVLVVAGIIFIPMYWRNQLIKMVRLRAKNNEVEFDEERFKNDLKEFSPIELYHLHNYLTAFMKGQYKKMEKPANWLRENAVVKMESIDYLGGLIGGT